MDDAKKATTTFKSIQSGTDTLTYKDKFDNDIYHKGWGIDKYEDDERDERLYI